MANYIESSKIYIYPSANAMDKGDINSEYNISGISKHLIQKPFIISDSNSKGNTPLGVNVDPSSSNNFIVHEGAFILEGYYVKIISKDSSDIAIRGSVPTDEGVYHLIFELNKNSTGNLNGDLYTWSVSSDKNLVCQACEWKFVEETSTGDLDIAPGTIYIDIATYNRGSTSGNFVTDSAIYNTRSAYINIDSVYTLDENGNPSKLLTETVSDIDKLSSINLYVNNPDTNEDYRLWSAQLDKNKGFQIIKYDTDGNPISTEGITPAVKGGTTMIGEAGHQTPTNNGSSDYSAKADHDHDSRYILNSNSKYTSDKTQKISTELDIVKLQGNQETTVCEFNPYDESENVLNVVGNVVVSGTITASQVYNAVWNDYCELYKKEFNEIDYDEGTVICKVPNKDTYAESDYSKRKLVVGVVSNSYGHLLGGDKNKSLEENLKEYIPVALAGRIPVKVELGKIINEGDLLTVSVTKGRVTTVAYPEPGTIVGKALESSDGTKDKILMQVMLG